MNWNRSTLAAWTVAGLMAVVLSRQIVLSPEEKGVAVQKLRDAFAEHRRQVERGEGTSAAGGGH